MRQPTLALLAALALGAMACTHAESTTVTHAMLATALPGPHVDGAISTKMVPALRDSVVTARLSIDSRIDASTPRPSLNVALCIDTSGSMEGKAIDDARKAALSFVAGIKPGDGFSLVTFDTAAHVVVPATRMTDDTDLVPIRASINAIKATGTTAMAEGLTTAKQQVRQLYDATRVNRVVLVSDGVPNEGSTLRTLAQQAQQYGISVSAMGLGVDYDEILMGDLAQLGGGRFKYIDDSSKIMAYLGDELTRITRVSARGASLEISPGPGVVVESVIGLPMSQNGRGGVIVSLGDVSLGSHRDVFFRLRAHGRRDGAPVELADATLRWVGTDGASHDEHFFYGAHATTDEDVIAKNHDDTVDKAAKEAQQAADAIDAIRKAQQSDKTPPAPVLGRGGGGGMRPSQPVPMSLPDVTKREHERAMQTLFGE
jgi:Ca-activated chloride channel family protein